MEELGKVVGLKGKNAVVEFERKTACSKCGMCAFGKDDMVVHCTLLNRLGANIGDNVKVHMGNNYVLVAAIIAYMIPLFLVGIAIACTFMLQDYIQFIAVVVALVIGFTTAALLDKFVIRKKKGFRPTMIEIVGEEEDKPKVQAVAEVFKCDSHCESCQYNTHCIKDDENENKEDIK